MLSSEAEKITDEFVQSDSNGLISGALKQYFPADIVVFNYAPLTLHDVERLFCMYQKTRTTETVLS